MLQNEWNLICTCTPVGSTPSAAPTAVTVSSAAGVVRTTNQPTTRTPSRSPSFKPSPASTITPTSYPISIYPKNQYIASSCLALLTPTLAKAQSFCSQNLAIDSCTVLASMGAFYPQKGSCSKYCQVVGLACVSAYDGWSCSRGYQRTCDYNRTDSTVSFIIFYLTVCYFSPLYRFVSVASLKLLPYLLQRLLTLLQVIIFRYEIYYTENRKHCRTD